MESDELTVGKGRFEALSDGVFAVAITLLVLEIKLPSGVDLSTPLPAQAHALLSIWPQYLVYIATFANIGIMWLNHHALLDRAHRITHTVIIANFCLLAVICFLPFATYVLEALGITTPAAELYGLTNVGIGVCYFFLQRAVLKAHGRPSAPLTAWNMVGLSAYPVAAIVAFFMPILTIVIVALVAVFYALPSNVGASRRHLEDPLSS